MTNTLIESGSGQVGSDQITVTVVMPVRNEGAFICRSLGAVLKQDYPADLMEVLIADGMSTDDTVDLIRETASKHPDIRLTLIENPSQIVAPALNRMIAMASGQVIIRVDGHTIISPNYVTECVAAIERSKADNVGGRMEAVSDSSFGRAVALATGSRFGVGGAKFHYSTNEEFVDTVYMGAWQREVFSTAGLFDEELVRNQDDEFNYRLRAVGGRVLLTPRIESLYYNRSTLRSLWRQYYQYGFWKVRVMQKHPAQMRLSHFVPACFVLSLLSVFLVPLSQLFSYALFGVVGMYLFSNLAASVFIGAKSGWRIVGTLPITFSVLHLSYGLGFLMGLFRFRGRWRERFEGNIAPPVGTGTYSTSVDSRH